MTSSSPEDPNAQEETSNSLISAESDILADEQKRRQVEDDLRRRGVTPSEIARFMNASSRTFDADLLPLAQPKASLPIPEPKKTKASSKLKAASAQADLMSFAASLKTTVSEERTAKIEQAALELPEFRDATLQDRMKAEGLMREAMLLRKSEKFKDAEAKCREALNLAPKDAPSLEFLGDLLQSSGRVDQALASYRRAVEADPKRATAERKFADLLSQQQNFESYDPEEVPKNPFVATLLSALIPGAGQFYNGEPVKGGVFMGLAIVLGLAVSKAAGSSTITSGGKTVAASNAHTSISTSFIAIGVATLVAYVVCLTDAMNTAKSKAR